MKSIFFILIISFLTISCTKERLTADGNIRSEIRNPGNFNQVRSNGSTHIHIEYGDEYKVELRGSGNLLPYYKTGVFSSTLDLGYERVNVRHDDIEVYITMPSIAGVTISGSGDVDISGNFPDQDRFDLRVSGSAQTDVHDAFRSSNVSVNISGSGDADLQRIVSSKSDVKISGSGSVNVRVEEVLDVNISGSGKVYYSGNPIVNSRISGSGKVIRN